MILRMIMVLGICFGTLGLNAQYGEPVLEIGIKKLNLYALEDKDTKGTYSFSFIKDVLTEVKLPSNIWRTDTVPQVDLVTQEEIMVLVVDSAVRVHNDLGEASPQEISKAVSEGFSLTKYCECVMASVDLIIIKKVGSRLHVNYADPKQVQKAVAEIDALSAGTKVVVSNVRFQCPKESKENLPDGRSYDYMAVVKVKD